MSLDAGSVYATLGGRFSPAGFNAFGSAMYKARGDMNATEKRADQMSKRASQSLHAMGTAAKVGAAGGIAALTGAIVYSIKKAADFEQQISALGSVSNASGRQLKLLKQQALDAGAATKYSALQAAQAQTELAKGGLSVTQILGGGLKAALALAAAGELDLGDAATYTVNAMKLFKLHGKDATHIADAFATAANSTTADVQDFGMALTQGGGAAKAAGYNFDQTVTILEALAEVGVKNSDAGTSMKTALLQLVGPTKKQAEASKQAGISFLDQHGQMKDITDISAMLRSKTDDMTKAQRTALFQTLAGTDGFRTLLALYDAGPDKLQRLQDGLQKQGTAAQVAAEKQDNLKGKVENLKGSLETAAIQIGSKFLPALSQLAEKGTAAVNTFVSTGGADRFAKGTINALTEVAHVGGDVIHVGGDVARVLLDIGQALDLGDATKIEALIAGIAGFKVAGAVAPMVAALANSLSGLVLNLRTAPTLAAFFAELPFGPIGVLAGAVGLLAAGLVILGNHESEEAGIAKRSAAAHREQADAIKAVSDAELAGADKGLAAKQAQIDHTNAVKKFNEVRKTAKKGSDEYIQAQQDVRVTSLRAKAAQDVYTESIKTQDAANQKSIDGAKKRLDQSKKTVDQLQTEINTQSRVDNPYTGKSTINPQNANPETIRAFAAALTDLTQRNQDYIQAVARSTVSDTNRRRLMQQSTQITKENTVGVAALISNLDKVPAEKRTKLLLQDQNALAQAGTLASKLDAIGQKQTVAKILTNAPSAEAAVGAFKAVLDGLPGSQAVKILQNAPSASAAVEAFRAIVKGVPASKVFHILHNADSAAGAVNALRGAIDALHDKSVSITTRFNEIYTKTGRASTPSGKVLPTNATGRGPGMRGAALIGEGAAPEWRVNPDTGMAYKTGGPEIARLDDRDYIIPTEDRYRGRALGLFAMLGRDLDIPGYASSRAPKKSKPKGPKRIVPAPPKDYRVGDPAEMQSDIQKLQGIQDDKTNPPGKAKPHLTKRAMEARRELRELRPVYTRTKRLADQIDANQARADNAYAALQLDDKKGDQKAFDKHLAAYKKALGAEETGLQSIWGALGKVKKRDTKYGRSVEAKILAIGGSIEDAGTTAMTEPDETPAQKAAREAGERLADTGMTDEERARLAGIDAAAALAALTPDLGDDTTAAQQKVDFLTGILNAVQADPARGGSASIASIAGDLKTARDNLESLTNPNGGSTNVNADVQAQIDQAFERGRVSGVDTTITDAARLAFSGPGSGVTQNIYTLHPGDSRTLRAVGGAAAAGFDASGIRRSASNKVGI